jgi:hypothetical protein
MTMWKTIYRERTITIFGIKIRFKKWFCNGEIIRKRVVLNG